MPTLEGNSVRLVPLSEEHCSALTEIGLDPALWELIPYRVTTREEMLAYIRKALRDQATGSAIPFATVEKGSSRVVGSTRFLNIDRANSRVEIGSTWLARPWQRTAINTEAKYLMLRYAFEDLACIRVELKTDAMNQVSCAAILRIGARQEGILRRHMATWTGRVRDTVYFSILDSEWRDVKASLEHKLSGS
jgi:RimJ/RimL family protein N-acetyltransferase